MNIVLELTAQARQKTGMNRVDAVVADGAGPIEALRQIVAERLPDIRTMVLDEQNQLASGWMLLVNGKLIGDEKPPTVRNQDVLTLLAPPWREPCCTSTPPA